MAFVFPLSFLVSCQTESGGSGDDGPCAAESGPSPIRRMTRREYDNTVRDLLRDESSPARAFVADEMALGFDNNATAMGVSQLLAEQYLAAAETLSERATEDLQGLLQCDPTGSAEDACVRSFVQAFGKRAYRRPLTADDETHLMAVYAAARQSGDVRAAVQAVLQVALQSPHFLYRVEEGELGPWELASRLSYFLWGTMPDEELFAAAEGGDLESAADVEAQARRMVVDSRARETVIDFHGQWLHFAHADEVEKEASVFPEFTPEIAALQRREAEIFVDHVAWSEGGDLAELFTADYTFANAPLAAFYGLSGPTGEEFQRVDLPGRASGALGLGGILSLLSKPNQTSPIHRGKFVREQLLCQVLPPPPEGIVITPPEPDPNASTRERFAQHSDNPACAGCHSLMDPIGFGFETYDGVGRWRDVENGQPVDASGELTDTDVDGPFTGTAELAARLAGSEGVRACTTLQWFRYAYGRGETDADECTLQRLDLAFAEAGMSIRELMVQLTLTEAFLHRSEGASP